MCSTHEHHIVYSAQLQWTATSMNTDLGSATVCHTVCNSSLAIDKHVLASVRLSQTDNIKIYIVGNKDCIDPYWCTSY